ncbi:hypothetical protein AMK26_08625 [Streptomyces sp. CB03234]|uniref:hypothetical protein n=1 Tax=Streptomyces sp. (strain CB03234) TaxID=1703937 RepID=UPI00093A0538|nr:hypothetical protein [Streptomyces sp. CB03234]OKK06125.1 hypothetical protein AMK26_08625 [Streptomyces sp. CB03234]
MRVVRERRGAVALVGVAVVAAVASGCGIRTTSVPVDAGAAPSRLPCSVSGEDVASRSQAQSVPVRVYLVCASGLEAVDRTVPQTDDKNPQGSRVATAQALLNQLLAEPSPGEREAGFTTSVEGPLTVSAARADDPEGALRLSRQPEDLPAAALSQIVCTYAENGATADGGTAHLGGPGPYPARRYACTAQLRERPDSAPPTRPSS